MICKLTKMVDELNAINNDIVTRMGYPENTTLTDDVEVHVFEQVWGSTALGFGGIGGQAMTAARIWGIIPESSSFPCYVYFGGSFAYETPYSKVLMDDIRNEQMEPVSSSGKYVAAVHRTTT